MQNKTTVYSAPENILSDILIRLTHTHPSGKDFPNNITKVFRMIGEYSNHDRIYIIEIHQNMTYSIKYAWNARSLHALAEKPGHQHLLYDSPLEEQLCKQAYIRIDESDEPLNPKIKFLLHEQACHRMLLLPLFEHGSRLAFIAFMQCQDVHEWDAKEIRLLSDFSSIIASQIHHYQLIRHLFHLLRQQEKSNEPRQILHTRLKQLHSEMIPTWEQVKHSTSNPEINIPASPLTKLEEQMLTLDKICRTYL